MVNRLEERTIEAFKRYMEISEEQWTEYESEWRKTWAFQAMALQILWISKAEEVAKSFSRVVNAFSKVAERVARRQGWNLPSEAERLRMTQFNRQQFRKKKSQRKKWKKYKKRR